MERQRSVLAVCVAVVVFGCGCRQEPPAPELREDPVLAEQIARQREQIDRHRAGLVGSLQEAAELEAALARNPEDLVTRERLLIFYAWNGKNPQSWDDNVAARRRHALWLAEHHPESDLVRHAMLASGADPVGYGRVRTLWESHIRKPDASVAVLGNAARFFSESEPWTTEQLLLRIQKLRADAQSGAGGDRPVYPAHQLLGDLYAKALIDSGNARRVKAGRGPQEAQRSSFASQVRAKLESTTDPDLLASTGTMLAFRLGGNGETGALARRYLRRALDIDPEHGQAKYALENIEASDRWQQTSSIERPQGPEAESNARRDRPFHLACFAEREYMSAESQDYRDRTSPDRTKGERAQARFANAKALAQEALKISPSLPANRSSCDVLFRANLVLASIAFREGDRPSALRYMLDASRAPAPELAAHRRFPDSLEGDLTNALLKHGERETVAEYLERTAAWRTAPDRARMLAEAAAIRDGRMPERYQRLLADGDI